MDADTGKKAAGASCGGGRCGSGPGTWIWLVLAVAVVGVLLARNAGRPPTAAAPAQGEPPAAMAADAAPKAAGEPARQSPPLPRLVDLGAGTCMPCKMMAPILEDLKSTYAGRMDVVFIDVGKNPDAGKTYGIRLIPTQIFYSPDGEELFRHEGFFGKEDILAKWQELGVDL